MAWVTHKVTRPQLGDIATAASSTKQASYGPPLGCGRLPSSETDSQLFVMPPEGLANQT